MMDSVACARRGGKRPLTMEIVSSFAKTLPSVKRSRHASYDGVNQAVKLFLEPQPKTESFWNANEYFDALGVVEDDVRHRLRRSVTEIKRELVPSEFPEEFKKKVAISIATFLHERAEFSKNLKASEDSPKYPDAAELTTKLQNLLGIEGKSEETIELISGICERCIHVLRAIHEKRSELQIAFTKGKGEGETALKKARAEAIEANSRSVARKMEAEGIKKKLEKLDLDIRSHIESINPNMAFNERNAVTLCMNAFLEPDEKMKEFISDRRELYRAYSQERDSVRHSANTSRVRGQVKDLMEEANRLYVQEAEKSLHKARVHRRSVALSCTTSIKNQISRLGEGLAEFIELQKERKANAETKVKIQRENEQRHIRLCGEMAPSELKEIRQKLKEYGDIRSQVVENMNKVALNQKRLWQQGLVVPTRAAPEVVVEEMKFFTSETDEEVEKAVLPEEVITLLQNSLENLQSGLMGQTHVDCFLEANKDILERSYNFLPLIKAEESDDDLETDLVLYKGDQLPNLEDQQQTEPSSGGGGCTIS